ncbi:MAG: Stp1/IreP family PP2C-type Ser/Thr phosphatase [Clostridia bacterium]|nr:Stp1/IreP family PP2C-type Ser/Thr phosphatase [Clostridia bacterium]
MLLYGMTDVGLYRKENEDYYTAAAWQRGEGYYLGVVCDGMGGANCGALASRTATEAFVASVQENRSDVAETLTVALRRANEAVRKKAAEDEERRGMGTTLVAALGSEETICLLHVGDSRGYLLHEGSLYRLTEDHSLVRALLAEGKIGEEEAEKSPYRNLLTRAVGAEDEVTGDLGAFLWSEGDRLLLCTDGLSSYVTEKEIEEIMAEEKDISDVAHELITAAECHGSEDNLTALLIENKKEKQKNA